MKKMAYVAFVGIKGPYTGEVFDPLTDLLLNSPKVDHEEGLLHRVLGRAVRLDDVAEDCLLAVLVEGLVQRPCLVLLGNAVDASCVVCM